MQPLHLRPVFYSKPLQLTNSTLNIHAELIARCRQNDAQAQYEIYQLYAKAMLNTAYRILGVLEDAEDVLQDSFINAFKSIHTYREEASFGAWLKRIVVNKALSAAGKVKLDLMSTAEDFDVADEAPRDDSQMQLNVQKVKSAMEALPPGFKNVLTLYLIEGFDHKEIAEVLNISESTSKTQYKRAKEKLKELLKSEVKYG